MGKVIQATDSRVINAIELYKGGRSMRSIQEELHMDGITLKRFLVAEGVHRDQSDASRRAKSNAIIYDDILDVLTPEAMYWIGFIYADGSIQSARPRIIVGLSEKDKEHLEKLSKFFGKDIPLMQSHKGGLNASGYIDSPSWRVQFSSRKLCQKLGEFGIHPRKTYDIVPPPALIDSHDFWRGVVDGDGWIYNTKVLGIGLCGHKNTVVAFLEFLNRNGLKIGSTPIKSKKSEHLWSCEMHHHKATAVINLLYRDACVYLTRKYEKYLELVKD